MVTHDGELENIGFPLVKDFFGRDSNYIPSKLDIFYDYYIKNKDFNFFLTSSKKDIGDVVDCLSSFHVEEKGFLYKRRVHIMALSLDTFFQQKTFVDTSLTKEVLKFFIRNPINYPTIKEEKYAYNLINSIRFLPKNKAYEVYKSIYSILPGSYLENKLMPDDFKDFLLKKCHFHIYSALNFKDEELRPLLKLMSKNKAIMPHKITLKRWESINPSVKEWEIIVKSKYLLNLENEYPNEDMPKNLVKAIINTCKANIALGLYSMDNLICKNMVVSRPKKLIKTIKNLNLNIPNVIQRDFYENKKIYPLHFLVTEPTSLKDKIVYYILCKHNPLIAYWGFANNYFEPTEKAKELYRNLHLSNIINVKKLMEGKKYEKEFNECIRNLL